jgi:plastocyanin
MLRSLTLLAALLLAAPAVAAREAPRPATRVTPVDVVEFEFGFKLSRARIPAGKVTFRMRNDGALLHNFHVVGFPPGPFLGHGQTARMTVRLKRGTYVYLCDVRNHSAEGMQGTLVVR